MVVGSAPRTSLAKRKARAYEVSDGASSEKSCPETVLIQPMKNLRCSFPCLAFATVFILGLAGLVGHAPGADEEEMPKEAMAAVKAVKQFLAATTVDERLRHTLGAEVMRPLMERYYKQASEEPVIVDRIEFVRLDSTPQAGIERECILSLESKAWKFSVPVMLQEEPDGFKVDWLAFVEFKDRLLEKFFQNRQEKPMRFHVGIQRAHYFGAAVPDAAGKDCFRLSSAPPNTFQEDVFLEKDTDLAKELRTSMPWETHLWVVAELEWKKLGAQQWVELKQVPQMHWYALPADARPIPPKQ
ncbi:MAG: hypothetical protein JWR15_3377 [Prosthecobacter sp.]|nr:hypothetical protein [Prosthecobacter sp.]